MKSAELALKLRFFFFFFTPHRSSRGEVPVPGHACRPLAETLLLTQSHTPKWFPKVHAIPPHENLSQTVFQCGIPEGTIQGKTGRRRNVNDSEMWLNKETDGIINTWHPPKLQKNSFDENISRQRRWCSWCPVHPELDSHSATSLTHTEWSSSVSPCHPLCRTGVSISIVLLIHTCKKNTIVNCFENFMLVSIFLRYLMPLKYNLWNEWRDLVLHIELLLHDFYYLEILNTFSS